MSGVIEEYGPAFTTYIADVFSVSPDNGPTGGGQALTVTGRNFMALAAVSIGGQPCGAVVVVSDTEITCTSPALLDGVYDVIVTNNGQAGSPVLPDAFTAYPAPTVLDIFQAGVQNQSGPAAGGTAIEVRGTGFLPLGAGPSVAIDGVACTQVEYVTPGIITCLTPAHAAGGPFDVVVTNDDAAAQSGTGVGLWTWT